MRRPTVPGTGFSPVYGCHGVSPPSGEVLSLACPRESTQRERHPVACPVINHKLMTGSPALLGKTGARATRDLAALDYAQTGASLIRFSLRCSAAPDGVLGGVPEPVVLAKHRWIPAFAGMTGQDRARESAPTKQPARAEYPSGAAEHRSHFGIERAALFELDLQAAGAANPASSASARNGEKRREPA